jgi:hypothetical protein
MKRLSRRVHRGLLADDGYQYGVMFTEKSVSHGWTGPSQRRQAEIHLEDMLSRPPFDSDVFNITLARRAPGTEWERVES